VGSLITMAVSTTATTTATTTTTLSTFECGAVLAVGKDSAGPPRLLGLCATLHSLDVSGSPLSDAATDSLGKFLALASAGLLRGAADAHPRLRRDPEAEQVRTRDPLLAAPRAHAQ
jgi:hypothetical protein